MADKDVSENPLKLTPDMQKRLEAMEGDIGRAEQAVKALKDLGLDTSDLDDKITWSRDVREILLKRFT